MKYIFYLSFLLSLCLHSSAQWYREIEGSLTYGKIWAVDMRTYTNPYEQSSQTLAINGGYNWVYRTRRGFPEFVFGGNLGYRNSTYEAYNIHTTGHDEWSFQGDFVELGGAITMRGVTSKEKPIILFLSVMPNYSLAGKYHLFIDHRDYSPVYDTLYSSNRVFKRDKEYTYVFGQFGFRGSMGIDIYISPLMRLRFAFNLGSSSRISSFDFSAGLCHALRSERQGKVVIEP